MTDDECRAIIQQIVLTGTIAEIDTIDDRMDIAIFRAGMLKAAEICEDRSTKHQANLASAPAEICEAEECASAIREAAK